MARSNTLQAIAVESVDNPMFDLFGRSRVGSPIVLWDSKLVAHDDPLRWADEQVSGAGTASTRNANLASQVLSVGANTAGSRVRQTRSFINYQPGRPSMTMLTGTLGSHGTGITSRLGRFTAENGIFFERSNGVLSVVLRSSTSGAPVDTRAVQSAWNIDQLSAVDLTVSRVWVVEYAWLGSGEVRLGVVDGSGIRYCHHFGTQNLVGPEFSNPNLPVRYEISNDGTGAAASILATCSAVAAESGHNPVGITRGAFSAAVGVLAAGTTYALVGLRLASSARMAQLVLKTVSVLLTTANDTARWSIRLNPTVAGTFAYTAETDSIAEVARGTNANTVTDGTVLQTGYTTTSTPTNWLLENALSLGGSVGGTMDAAVLCCTPVSGNLSAHGAINWSETV